MLSLCQPVTTPEGPDDGPQIDDDGRADEGEHKVHGVLGVCLDVD